MPSSVNRDTIVETERRIRPYIRRTPIVEICGADFGLSGGKIHLKLELTQHSGSFKARGAFANLLMRDVPVAGVVAASGHDTFADLDATDLMNLIAKLPVRAQREAAWYISNVGYAATICRIAAASWHTRRRLR